MDKNKKKKTVKVNPYFVLGLLNGNSHALGGPIDNPNNTDVTGMLPIDYDRVNTGKETAKGALTGALQGAQTGASLGSIIPGVGTLIGGAAGAIIGGVAEGIKGHNNAKDIQDLNEEMFKDNYEPIHTFALGGPIKGKDNSTGRTHPLAAIDTGGDPNVTDPNARGYRDPLDGSDELEQEQAAWALLKGKYGDINFFAQKDNEFRQSQENKSSEELTRADIEGNLSNASLNPDNMGSTGDVGFLQSARKAMNINKVNRQNNLGYQKIKLGAFVADNPDEAPSFANGGELNVNNIKGPTHEEGGIPMAKAEVEGGEAKLGDYIFSDRLTRSDSKRTFSQHAKSIELKYKDRDNDGPAQRSKSKELESLMAENEISRKQEEVKQAQLESMLQADAYAYGGYLKKYSDGGSIEIDPKMNSVFKNLAKKRGLKLDEYTEKLMAYGGNLTDGDPPFLKTMFDNTTDFSTVDESAVIDPKMDYLNQSLKVTGIASDYTIPTNDIIDTPTSTNTNKTTRFGNEEAALALSNLPALGNYIESFSRRKTNLNKVNPDTISLDTQRDQIQNEYAKARSVTRENIRGNATSSGQALSNMAASNSALTNLLSNDLSQSYLNEENANNQILNQANQLNTQIGNEEIIANEQNADLRRSLQNRALADVAMNSQGYLKDKKMTSENIRQNERLMSIINNVFPNYKWTQDNGEFAIKFLSQLQETENLLPNTKQ